MKPNYKNWIPKGMIIGLIGAAVGSFVVMLIFSITGIIANDMLRLMLIAAFAITCIYCTGFSIWSIVAYNAFSYNGKRQLSKQIIEGVAEYVSVPEGGKILDIGCGSGALSIACAKRNPTGSVVGIDRWGKEYASFSKELCEINAKAEGTHNTSFINGNAVKLEFPDESFDAVTSNYVLHNISNHNKQQLLLETLRVLKKGGIFAIHDIMTPQRYGNMNDFKEKLINEGYNKVELIDTTNGMLMSQREAKKLMLKGSMILYGKK